MSTVRLQLPTYHQAQTEIDNDLSRFNVLACGRRFGKDVYMMNKGIETGIDGYPIAWGAPTYKMLTENWRAVNYLIAPIVARKNKQERQVELATGGIIDFWSLDNPNMIRGRKYKRFIINEGGFVPDLMDIWNYIIRATLVDLEGDAIIGGTPKGRNGFWKMYQYGIDPDNKDWVSFKKSSYENPFIPSSEIDEMVDTLPERTVQQEIYAEFLENAGAVFRNIAACMNAPVEANIEDHEGHTIVAGLDWGKQQDFTASSVGCSTCRVELARDRFNKIDWHFQYKRVQVLHDKWNVDKWIVEHNSIGDPGLEALQRAGLPVLGFDTTASSKPPLIENLALTFEREEWQFQDDPIWTGELEAYERKVSATTGRSTYSAPEGLHDDTVMARALMVWSGNMPSGADLVGYA